MKSFIAVLGTVCVVGVAVGVAAAEVPGVSPVYRSVDAATGATVTVYRPAPDRALVEVEAGSLRIVKSLAPGVAETRLLSPHEDLAIRLTRAGVSVRDGRLGVVIAGADEAGLQQARARLRASRVVRDAIGLLGRLGLPGGSPVSHTLRVTEALLEAAVRSKIVTGRAGGPRPLVAPAPRPLAVAYRQEGMQTVEEGDGPTGCWDAYAKEAIAAWIEYEQCVDSEEWWDAIGLVSCAVIYEMRALGAFSWWVSCVGFRG
jgi:hypothetical protein